MLSCPLNMNEKAHKLVTGDKVRTALLKHKGPDAKYKSFNIVDFCAKGDNYACFVTSVEVEYQIGGEDEKVTYIAKVNNCQGMDCFEPFTTFLFEKEGNFYQKMVPSLNETLNNIGLPPIKFAPSYFASLEPKSQVLLLGDIRKNSFKMADRFKGLDDDHVILVVKELARLHASSSIHEDNLGCEKFLEMHDYLEDFYTGARIKSFDPPMLDDLFVQYVNNGAKIAERVGGYEKVAAWLKELAPRCNDALSKEVSECDLRFRVVNHGDCWNNNLLFKYDGAKVMDVCLLDLQMNRHASLALDLNYFLYTSLDGDTRRKGLTSYLTSYYDSFKEVFRAAVKPMKFTLDELNKEFRNKNLFGLILGLMVIPIALMESTDVTDMSDVREDNVKEKKEEQQQKILAMVEKSPGLRPRLLDMFDDMVEHGTINLS